MATSITLKSLSRRFGSVQAVREVSLTIEPGEMFYLLGPSGCGKTTLLRLIAGVLDPTSGEVWMGDRDVTRLPPAKRPVSMVFQSAALWPHLSAIENVMMGLAGESLSRQARRQRAMAALDAAHLDSCAQRRPGQLSGGQQQRVALARAMVRKPEVLLLDEPMNSLDAASRRELRREVRQQCAAAGVTAIVVTHEQDASLRDASRLGVMRDGRLEQVGTPGEVYLKPANRFVAEFFGETNIVPATVRGNVEGKPDLIKLDTPIGELQLQDNEKRLSDSIGARILCAIRPEAISFAAAKNRCNSLYGKWLGEMVLGGATPRRLLVNDTVLNVIGWLESDDGACIGDRIQVSIDPADIWVLPGDGYDVG